MKRWVGLAGLMVGLMVWLGVGAGLGQTAGCTLNKQVYTCDRAEFQRTLMAAKTARVEEGAQDRMVSAKVRELVVSLGKAVVGGEEQADLTFSLEAKNTEGVLVGPAGLELAVLRVYGRGADGGKGNLVWAETYTGQADMSWPAVVQATINQFRASQFRAGLKR